MKRLKGSQLRSLVMVADGVFVDDLDNLSPTDDQLEVRSLCGRLAFLVVRMAKSS